MEWWRTELLKAKADVWFDAVVGGQPTGRPAWQATEYLLLLKQPGETILEVRSKGDRDFYVGQVTLERTEPFWPKEMITDAGFFASLDRGMPGLKAILAAAEAGDYDRACREMAAHFRAAPRNAAAPWGGAWASSLPKKKLARPPEAADLALENNIRPRVTRAGTACSSCSTPRPPARPKSSTRRRPCGSRPNALAC